MASAKDTPEMTFRFGITQEMIDRFVEFTRDRNAMHVSEEFARRMRYRRRVVHGMLPFSFLMRVQEKYSRRLMLARCETKFLKPIFADDSLRMEVAMGNEGEEMEFKAEWYNDGTGELLIKASGAFRGAANRTYPGTTSASSESFIIDDVEENVLTMAQLQGRSEAFSFRVSPELAGAYWEGIVATKAPAVGGGESILAVALLSTMVGMRIPGRFATFTGFSVAFEKAIEAGEMYQLQASVEKMVAATETVELAVQYQHGGKRIGSGKVSALVNPAPRATVTSAELKEKWFDLGLKEKVAIVSGASRGIGAATAKLLGLHGARVVVNYHRGKGDAERVVEDIQSAGGEAIALQCDITDEEQVEAFVRAAREKFGTVDVLVNNAVKDTQPRDVSELSWEEFSGEMDVTVKGAHLLCRAIVPIMKAKRFGKIINISTIYVDNPVRGQSKYITAKSALIGYTRSLAKELAGDNIQVNALAPNMTETDLLAALPTAIVARMGSYRSGGANLSPAQVAQAIVFLASRWSDSMTGQKVVLNLGEPPFT